MGSVDLRRDGYVLAVFAALLVMLAAGLSGAYQVFGYALVGLLGVLSGHSFIRRGDLVTWVPPVVATAVMFAAFAGMFATEHAVVRSAFDTYFGFQAGTAFLIYGVWIPPFFTLGVAYSLLFDRLMAGEDGFGPSDREPRR